MEQQDYEAEVLRVWAGSADGSHDLGHLRRVRAICCQITAEMDAPVDQDVLLAAAIFHDVINLAKDDPERHRAAELSADHAVGFLAARGMAPERLDQVYHAICAHSFSAGVTPVSLEARILQDADRLEALGAIGIARCFNVSGQLGRGLFDAEDPLAQRRDPDDQAWALDHFEIKLYRIAESMQTAPGREMAQKRVAFMRRFVAQLLAENAPDQAVGSGVGKAAQ
jgi:uncharacterized protein